MKQNKLSVLVACEYSGIVRESFLALGHRAISCDLLPTELPGPHFEGDVFDCITKKGPFDLMIAHPPCTHLSSSGARWWPKKREDGSQQAAVDFFLRLAHFDDIPFRAVENPIGLMSKSYRKPDQIVQPYFFGDPERKSTCLWLYGLPVLQKTEEVEPEFMKKPDGTLYLDKNGKPFTRVHFLGSKADRGKERSRFFPGMSAAMASQWTAAILRIENANKN